jgi:hypothetical protein
MGGLLSAISGQFAKAIILGTLFPVIILSVLNILLVAPLMPQTESLPVHLAKIAVGDEKWSAVVLTFVVLLLTGLLYNLNIPIIRLCEGYPWAESIIGKCLMRLQERRFDDATALRASVDSVRERLSAAAPGIALLSTLNQEYDDLSYLIDSQLPDSGALLLPTRLGNIIRCFERYPKLAYGIDAIAVWPRLIAKIESPFASTIDEAKISFDFMLNTCFLSALTACAILAIGLAQPTPLELYYFLPMLWRTAVFVALATVFYWLAVNRAFAWGQQVRSAFDLYRFDLLKQMGYARIPRTNVEEKAVWNAISTQLLYASTPRISIPYEEPSARVIPFPADIELSVQRKYGVQEPNLRISVLVVVANLEKTNTLKSLTLIEPIPDGYKFVPNTASVSTEPKPKEVTGLNVTRLSPFEILIGPLAASSKAKIRYFIRPIAP